MSEETTQKIYEFGDFRLIPGEELLLKDGTPIALTPKAFQTLFLLVKQRGHLVQKEELLNSIWGDAFVEEQAAAKTISAIRNALSEDSRKPEFIQTIPKRGYRFVGQVRETEATGNGMPVAAPPPVEPKTTYPAEQPTLRRFSMTIGFGMFSLVAIIVALGWSFGGWPKPVNVGAIKSLTVLPFENVSGNSADEYVVQGVTDSLTADLSRIGDLSFIPLSKEISDAKGAFDPKAVGQQIGADAVLSGTVVRSGERIRITAHLVDSVSGKYLWASTYERQASDLQSIQKELARNVVEEIRANVSSKDLDRLRVRRPVDPRAYDEYQLGRYHLNRQNAKDQEIGIAALEKAVEIDPKFALGYTELAQAYTWEHFSFSPEKTAELAEKASIASAKALDLEPELAEAYLARGRVLWTPARKFPHERAIRDYLHALELDPKLDEARNQIALVYCHIGALDEALRESYEGVKTNPNNNLLLLRIGQSLNSQGKYAEALSVLRGIPEEVHPSMTGHQTVWALLNLGRIDEAAAKTQQLMNDHPDDLGGTFASLKAVLAAMAGQNSTAQKYIAEAVEKGKGFGHFHHTAYTIACAYALMNKVDDAVRYLEMAVDTGFPCYPAFEIEPTLSNIRQDPRFIAFMSRAKDRFDQIRRDSGL
jgi:TolB-like protein/DNA-binding winged helix-turn-helix (wHTH) protein/Tfp pilus assembly protein PilF